MSIDRYEKLLRHLVFNSDFSPPSSGSDSQKKLGERMSKEERRKRGKI